MAVSGMTARSVFRRASHSTRVLLHQRLPIPVSTIPSRSLATELDNSTNLRFGAFHKHRLHWHGIARLRGLASCSSGHDGPVLYVPKKGRGNKPQMQVKTIPPPTISPSSSREERQRCTRKRVGRVRKEPPEGADDAEDNGDAQKDQTGAAKAAGLKLVSRRMYTRHELAQKLVSKNYSQEDVDASIAYLQELGLMNDKQYTVAYARMKWRTSKWAASRTRAALQQKGVLPADLESGLAEAFVDLEPQADQDEGGWMKELLRASRAQWQRSSGKPSEARERRMVAWLQRRGHSWDVIHNIMDELKANS
mmetsp:Transcript_25692/g.48722  ORF Transcript_25692/g.48722 Transcript_25692/m.48722 type:complete len:308 (+) Transcript_25692:46-969(+)